MDAYRYTESGLDNVLIEGADLHDDDAGEECITIPNVGALHKAITLGIVHRRPLGMTGRELRFIRTEMGMTQAELAAMVHREPLAVSRWERGESPLDSNAEALIRLYAMQAGAAERTSARSPAGACRAPRRRRNRMDRSDPSNYRVAA